MTGQFDDKVALITGAARGQGRSHAVRFAEEGADIVAIDICDEIDCVPYQLATSQDLEDTAKAVEALGRKIVARVADVRDAPGLRRAVAEATNTVGPIDIVVANAGIAAAGGKADPDRGGAIVLISSTQGLKGTGGDGTAAHSAYSATKHGVVGLMRSLAHWLASDNIRVNTVHPTGVETPMIMNDAVGAYLAENPQAAQAMVNLLAVPMLQPADVSDAVLWLVSDHAKYVTGVTLPVDAGFCAR